LLVKLEEAGRVAREEDRIRIAVTPDAIEEEARGLAGQFETLRTQDNRRLDALGVYARTTDCRASFLRAYFGEEDAEPCELCDNCEQRKPRSAGFFAPLRAPDPKQKKKKTKRKRRRGGEARRKTKRKPRRPRGKSRARRKSRNQ